MSWNLLFSCHLMLMEHETRTSNRPAPFYAANHVNTVTPCWPCDGSAGADSVPTAGCPGLISVHDARERPLASGSPVGDHVDTSCYRTNHTATKLRYVSKETEHGGGGRKPVYLERTHTATGSMNTQGGPGPGI